MQRWRLGINSPDIPTVCPSKLLAPIAKPSANSPGPWMRPCNKTRHLRSVSFRGISLTFKNLGTFARENHFFLFFLPLKSPFPRTQDFNWTQITTWHSNGMKSLQRNGHSVEHWYTVTMLMQKYIDSTSQRITSIRSLAFTLSWRQTTDSPQV